MSLIRFAASSPTTDIPTPPSGYIYVFMNSSTGALSYKDSTGAVFSLTNLVASVFGRTGAVIAATNDYTEAQISFSDITTNNVSTSKHGLVPKAPNDATKFLDGTGAYSVPAGTVYTADESTLHLAAGVFSMHSSAPIPGSPTTTTQSYGDNSTKVATDAFVQSAIATRVDSGNSGTTKTLDWSSSNFILSTLTGNVTYTFTAPSPALGVLVLEVVQGSGPYTITWPAAVHWAGGSAPTLTATNAKKDIFTFYYNGTTYYGVVSGQNYTA